MSGKIVMIGSSDEWKKVEGRFKPTSINIKYDQCLSLIGHIIPKTGQWKNFKAKFDNADTYIRLLKDLGDYVTEHYPKYAKYVELINLLGSEYDMKTASQIMGKADSTLYDWVKRLRPIYDEFRETVDYL